MTKFDDSIVNKIIHRIRQGRSIVKICAELGIGESTVYDWLKDKDKLEFQEKYARAKEDSADYLADELLEIADNELTDVQSRRIRIDTRKWIASKLKAKKYGDSTQIKLADADGNKFSLDAIFSSINGSTSDLPRDDEIPE